MKIIIKSIKKNQYCVFLFKLVLLFMLVSILDYSIGNILRYFYFKQESGEQYRTTYSIEKTNADLLIFGSSRANHHYDPNVFENRLNLSYYNVGRDGNGILYHSAILKAILKRYKPKVIVLDLNAEEFRKNQESYERLSSLLPYYKKHEEIHSIIEYKSKFEKFKLISNIYPFNSSLLTIAIGNTEYNKKRRSDIKGFVPLKKIWNKSIEYSKDSIVYKTDNIKICEYQNFIKKCIKSKVKLYIVVSPIFRKFAHTEYSIKIGQEIAKKYNIRFLNFTNETVFLNNSKLFEDPWHLNEKGAEIFSSKLSDDLLILKN